MPKAPNEPNEGAPETELPLEKPKATTPAPEPSPSPPDTRGKGEPKANGSKAPIKDAAGASRDQALDVLGRTAASGTSILFTPANLRTQRLGGDLYWDKSSGARLMARIKVELAEYHLTNPIVGDVSGIRRLYEQHAVGTRDPVHFVTPGHPDCFDRGAIFNILSEEEILRLVQDLHWTSLIFKGTAQDERTIYGSYFVHLGRPMPGQAPDSPEAEILEMLEAITEQSIETPELAAHDLKARFLAALQQGRIAVVLDLIVSRGTKQPLASSLLAKMNAKLLEYPEIQFLLFYIYDIIAIPGPDGSICLLKKPVSNISSKEVFQPLMGLVAGSKKKECQGPGGVYRVNSNIWACDREIMAWYVERVLREREHGEYRRPQLPPLWTPPT